MCQKNKKGCDCSNYSFLRKFFQGTETLLGIRLPFEEYFSTRPLLIDKESFKGMRNLQYLEIGDWSDGVLPQSLVYFPRKLKRLWWNDCPLKRLPSNFKAEYLVQLRMENSKLEKLWDGTQVLILLVINF